MGALRAPVLLAAMSCFNRVPRVHIRLLSSEIRSDKSDTDAFMQASLQTELIVCALLCCGHMGTMQLVVQNGL